MLATLKKKKGQTPPASKKYTTLPRKSEKHFSDLYYIILNVSFILHRLRPGANLALPLGNDAEGQPAFRTGQYFLAFFTILICGIHKSVFNLWYLWHQEPSQTTPKKYLLS